MLIYEHKNEGKTQNMTGGTKDGIVRMQEVEGFHDLEHMWRMKVEGPSEVHTHAH